MCVQQAAQNTQGHTGPPILVTDVQVVTEHPVQEEDLIVYAVWSEFAEL